MPEQQRADHEGHSARATVKRLRGEPARHATSDEGLRGSDARPVIADECLADPAKTERASSRRFIEQLRGHSTVDDQHAARFTSLCDHVLQQMEQEERQMFAHLEASRFDWAEFALRTQARSAATHRTSGSALRRRAQPA